MGEREASERWEGVINRDKRGQGHDGRDDTRETREERDARATRSADVEKVFAEWNGVKQHIAELKRELASLIILERDMRRATIAAMLGSDTTLTRRQEQVLALVQDGKSNKEIAIALGIEERTAKFHVSAILSRFGKLSRREL